MVKNFKKYKTNCQTFQKIQKIRVWQPNPAEVAEDEVVSQARVCCSRQLVVPDVEPREHRASQSVHGEVERVRCSGSVDCV